MGNYTLVAEGFNTLDVQVYSVIQDDEGNNYVIDMMRNDLVVAFGDELNPITEDSHIVHIDEELKPITDDSNIIRHHKHTIEDSIQAIEDSIQAYNWLSVEMNL